ncbi:uncharacterized protein LOC129585070 [Paramacrobiotus metropolitanus]|uniref:uncharacterized protein LOC129585070 n=1 Tax=Paramacrobiotus metropolitanus TaxID=2943436 RepID=UPI002445A57D|nr:uncharacterized protein LOC129585070 [Paramacrobiotus metropolitanus]
MSHRNPPSREAELRRLRTELKGLEKALDISISQARGQLNDISAKLRALQVSLSDLKPRIIDYYKSDVKVDDYLKKLLAMSDEALREHFAATRKQAEAEFSDGMEEQAEWLKRIAELLAQQTTILDRMDTVSLHVSVHDTHGLRGHLMDKHQLFMGLAAQGKSLRQYLLNTALVLTDGEEAYMRKVKTYLASKEGTHLDSKEECNVESKEGAHLELTEHSTVP